MRTEAIAREADGGEASRSAAVIPSGTARV
jgi:hypothetical protein